MHIRKHAAKERRKDLNARKQARNQETTWNIALMQETEKAKMQASKSKGQMQIRKEVNM